MATSERGTQSDEFRAEANPRAFRIETIPYKGRHIRFVSLEADHIRNRAITPANWKEHVSHAMDDADLTFVEYFTPELEEKMPYFHKKGSFSRDIANVYGAVARLAREKNKDVAVADIANKPLYEAYQLGMFPVMGFVANTLTKSDSKAKKLGFLTAEAYMALLTYHNASQKGAQSPEQSRIEKFLLQSTDARRILTARGIMQTANIYPEGSILLYIGATAHTTRVKNMIESGPTIANSAKTALYKNILVGLDKSTRTYTPTDSGWSRVSNVKIR